LGNRSRARGLNRLCTFDSIYSFTLAETEEEVSKSVSIPQQGMPVKIAYPAGLGGFGFGFMIVGGEFIGDSPTLERRGIEFPRWSVGTSYINE
jgi:hypothetical protein